MLEDWIKYFSPLLSGTKRYSGFLQIAEHIFSIKNPLIIETGCVRNVKGWEGDGCSTLIWDWLCINYGARCISFDNKELHITIAKKACENVEIRQDDSILGLAQIPYEQANQCALLYLDSYDYLEPHALSEMHHLGELAAVYEKLPSGCMIAVDDCHSDESGKHLMVKYFFDRMGVKEAFTGYITAWIKP